MSDKLIQTKTANPVRENQHVSVEQSVPPYQILFEDLVCKMRECYPSRRRGKDEAGRHNTKPCLLSNHQ